MRTSTKQFRRSTDPTFRPFVRDGLHPRVVYFPASIIEEHDREPGQLIELVTLALSAYLADGKAVNS